MMTMTDSVINEYAIAVRMTCSNPGVTGGAATSPLIVSFWGSGEAGVLAGNREALEARVRALGLGAVHRVEPGLTPDGVAESVAAGIRKTGTVPGLVAIESVGVLAVGRTGVETARTLALLRGGGPATAPSAHAQPSARLQGCIAAVTGGAQGFGRGIAEELARHGACVAVADLKDDLGNALAADLNRAYGDGTAAYFHTDVTEAASVDACVQGAVRAFGGLDLFVANAGVLKAGGLDEMDEAAFDLVTRVNYKAYFLCARSAAAVMKRQHQVNPHHFMDIVQINSKSGLQGSNRNFAYAGSKFGTIGLTQSFALELIAHHIKVNSICPGNYFDGPLWSDPERGLFVQYLQTGKVPGATTLEDVKRFYMSKVPMNRGCTPADVTTAILYLHDQLYETGQALPVTGGQVMLK